MGRRKTKFEVSLGEVSYKNITIKFETDQSDEAEVLESVRGALGNIIGTPTRLLMLEADRLPDRPVSPAVPADIQLLPSSSPSKPRRRRRPLSHEQTKAHPMPGSNGDGEAVETGAGGVRPGSVKDLILQLHGSRYFQEERSSFDVGQELSNRWGRNIKTNHVATILQQLTGDVLSRRKTDDRKMLYRSMDHAR